MEVGLIGLGQSGKTTLFRALTGGGRGARVVEFSEKPNLGVANIPDPRLGIIAQFITTQKIVPATIQLVDIPGPPTSFPSDSSGGSSTGGGGVGKLNHFLEHVRQVDAVALVVRCFDDGSGIDGRRDLERMESELILADLVVAESARERSARPARSGDRDARARLATLEKVVPWLEEGRPVRAGEWSEVERGHLRGYGLITAKPVLYVANVGEDDLVDSAAARSLAEEVREVGGAVIAVCATLEAELAELEEGDRTEMLESMGLSEPAIGPLARGLNEVLGLTTFYTAGPKEVRAWSIPRGATAPEAAGAIHSDIQRGFIRAECYHVDDLVKHKTEKAIREHGKMRSEGKGYVMRDGDVVHFLFNV